MVLVQFGRVIPYVDRQVHLARPTEPYLVTFHEGDELGIVIVECIARAFV